MMKRFLGLTEEEIVENEEMWREERDEPEVSTTQGQDLRSIGVTPAGMESDIETGQELAGAEGMSDVGGAGTPGAVAGNTPGAGAAATPAGAAPPVPGL